MSGGDFAAIEARLAEASEGPWESDGNYNRAEISQAAGDWATIVGTEEVGSGHLRENVLILSAADSQFIAHAREDIPRLLAAVRERDNTIARVRAVLDDYDGLDAEPIPKLSTHAWMHEVRAALDPQETP